MNCHPQRVLRATLSDSPGGLTNVVQVFSGLSQVIDRLDFQRPSNSDQASAAVIYLRAEDRMIDLALRKLGRLIDVLSVQEIEVTPVVEFEMPEATAAIDLAAAPS
jgi:acetolactate synthase small subunit